MRRMAFAIAVAMVALAARAEAAESVVDTNWVKANLGKPGIVFVDIRPAADYQKGFVSGAVSAPYPGAGWQVRRGELMSALPAVAEFEALMGRLGIDNKARVVVVSAGGSDVDMARSTHVFWIVKANGHDAVSLVDGGFAAYGAAKDARIETQRPTPERKTYKATLRSDIFATDDDVRKGLGRVTFVDTRVTAQFLGINKIGGVARYGTIPGAKNLSYSWLTDDAGGQFQTKAGLAKIFAHARIPLDREVIVFSNTGLLASLVWFAGHEILGNKAMRLYDAGMSQWALAPTNAVERHVVLD